MTHRSRALFTAWKRRLKLVRKRTWHQAKLRFHYAVRRRPREPVFIVTTRRTGSNLFLEYLNSAPNLSFLPEILNSDMFYGVRGRWIGKRRVLRHIAHSINGCRERVCGAKLCKVHMELHRVDLEDLKRLYPNARFIILYRKSLLEQFVSLKIAEQTGSWQWHRDFRLPQSIELDEAEFRAYSRMIKGFYENIFNKVWVAERSVIVRYEELVQCPQLVFDEVIFPFLGVARAPVRATLKKQNTLQSEALVRNLGTLKRSLGDEAISHDYAWPVHEETRVAVCG